MWNKRLARLATQYPTGILSVADVEGFPASVRLVARLDIKRLEGLHQMVLKGELVEEDGAVVLRVADFVTANGSNSTDEMPHAGSPILMLRFLRLGRRKAREYERKRGEPWPPIDYAEVERILRED
jgi:hypothetical protein